METEVAERMLEYIKVKALRRSAIRYSAIYKFFPSGTSNVDVWNAFEEVCNRIAKPEDAIYGALMAKKSSLLPGAGFFDAFRNTRRKAFFSVTNNNGLQANQLTNAQKEIITKMERERVHRHAVVLGESTVRIFEPCENFDVILAEVQRRGVAGISGGRLEVREMLKKLIEHASSKAFEVPMYNVTYNHFATELAYPHDPSRINSDYALMLVLGTYDRTQPDY